MDVGLTIAVVASVVIVAAILFWMQRKHLSFSVRVLTALGAGIALGFIFQFFFDPESNVIVNAMDWIGIVGTGYVRFLQMIMMPLIFVAILSAFTRIKAAKEVGKISGLVIGMLVVTTIIAGAIGFTSASVFNLSADDIQVGSAEQERGLSMEERYDTMESTTIPQQIVQLIPTNPFADLTGARPTSTLGVVIFAAFLGVAYLGVRRKEPQAAEMFEKIIGAIFSVVMRVVTLILRLTPYGVLAIMTSTVAQSDLGAVMTLGTFVIASYVALAAVFLVHLLILLFMGLSPVQYLKKAFPVLAFAFTSRTSAAALPMNIQTQKKLGVPEGTANFAGSFGLSIGQNGCAGVYPAMLAFMIAPTVGQNPFEPGFIAMLLVVIAISSFGVAGVGGGATFAAILVLAAMDLPIALAGLLISIEPLIDMGRTAVNVSGSMISGIFTSKVKKDLNVDDYKDDSLRIDVSEEAS
ncbi:MULTISPECIES: L-cystine transporter [Bacillaceae]|uniref:L-cystine uptake protein TcyP n=4 Tax=Bacillaceae TaxID=186817 RepID=A0A9D5HZV2_9BACI|nr:MULTISPECIES: L-cystine transporter [Bacillaceae]RQW22583.1 L-cystine transporter [Bacillus sp. C1-1]KQL56256.1 sodium:dicarboxylate symporter [Alkalicoccobacillus plakortidis]MBG9783219.1 sodium:dicarboxylate symporter [Shouchella lehensis]MED4128766.1 L-cystine transporter [Shouchella miscanthi]TES49407.1 L-cystine transporter [Shouchella lehensis]